VALHTTILSLIIETIEVEKPNRTLSLLHGKNKAAKASEKKLLPANLLCAKEKRCLLIALNKQKCS
jgi:hypothetical protein